MQHPNSTILLDNYIIMKIKYKQWWSTTLLISIKQTITSHLTSPQFINIEKTTIYDIGNPGPGLGHTKIKEPPSALMDVSPPPSPSTGITYFIVGWSILQHDLNNIQEVLHFEHCVNLWCKYRFSPKTLASNISM